MPTLKYKDPVTGEYKSDIHVVGAVSSVNGKTGAVELTNSDIPNAITDVQVNGASVVTDGVANIEKASTSAFGVVKIGTNLGVTLSSDGTIRVSQATTANIDDRNRLINPTQYPPIVPYNLDYAVKAAMTDGIGAAWTPTEQAAARERLGMSDFREYGSETLSESTANIEITFEKPVSGIAIFLQVPNQSSKITAYFLANGSSRVYLGAIPADASQGAMVTILGMPMNGMVRFEGKVGANIYSSQNTLNGVYRDYVINSKITNFKIAALSGATFPVGTQMQIYVAGE